MLVPFREKRLTGYVVSFSSYSIFKKLRPILQLLDKKPLLDKQLLDLAKELSSYYFCSLGEAISVALPPALRKGGKTGNIKSVILKTKLKSSLPIFINDSDNKIRWEIYTKHIKDAIKYGRGIIFLAPDSESLARAVQYIKNNFNEMAILLSREQSAKEESAGWLEIRNSKTAFVVGRRSAVFAPVNNLGLIIVDEESDSSFKQEQNPFYHTRAVAFMRSKLTGAKVILASQSPSLEALYLLRTKQLKTISSKKEISYPNVSVVDMKDQFSIRRRKYPLLSMTLENRMQNVLAQKGKIILFHNRRGFARTMRCKKCGFRLSCPRCEVDLIHNYDKKSLSCPYCSYAHQLIKFCPECKSSYIQFKAPGIEKLESELYRLFPNTIIKTFDGGKLFDNFDILVTTQKILGYNFKKVDLVGVISADMLWSRAEFQAQERAFNILSRFMNLAKSDYVIQTFFTEHAGLQALKNKNPSLFFKKELSERKRLGFPPFKHLINIQLRGENQKLVEQTAERVAEKIKQLKSSEKVEILSEGADSPKKLRGKFRFHILLKTDTINKKLMQGLRKTINRISHPRVILSVDVDPV